MVKREDKRKQNQGNLNLKSKAKRNLEKQRMLRRMTEKEPS
jgi:hypothetical protein